MVATITILGALPCLTFFCSSAKTSGLWSERHHSVRNSRLRLSDGNELGVDVHYTMPKILRASIAFAGTDKDLFRYVVDSVMDELAQIALKTGLDDGRFGESGQFPCSRGVAWQRRGAICTPRLSWLAPSSVRLAKNSRHGRRRLGWRDGGRCRPHLGATVTSVRHALGTRRPFQTMASLTQVAFARSPLMRWDLVYSSPLRVTDYPTRTNISLPKQRIGAGQRLGRFWSAFHLC